MKLGKIVVVGGICGAGKRYGGKTGPTGYRYTGTAGEERGDGGNGMKSEAVYGKLVHMNDEQVGIVLRQQVNDPGDRNDGGVVLGLYGVSTASHVGTASCMAAMAAALAAPQSGYYRSAELLSALDRTADFMLRRQHGDGTISLGGTNFNSPPDTGFVINGMAQIYWLLQGVAEGAGTAGAAGAGGESGQAGTTGVVREFGEAGKAGISGVAGTAAKVKLFLERTIPAMLTGGCHTPNHRWVLVAALSALYRIFGLESLVRRADEWLAEGLDGTNDGEWTERSNGIYNTVSNIMLIYAADRLNRPELLDSVRRNLNMMAYMIYEDGEVITDYSGRQDLGARHDLSEYFLCYRLMADRDRNPLFASMYDLSAKTMNRLGPVNNHALLGWLLFPCGAIDEIARAPLPDRFRRVFNSDYPIRENLARMEDAGHHGKISHSSMHTAFGSPVMRWREGELGATAMTRASSFFSLRYGDVRLAGISLFTLFSPGVADMEEFAETASGCRMGKTMEKGYYGPLAKEHLPASASEAVSPWYLLPHHLRPFTHAQKHTLETEIVRDGTDWLVRIRSDERQDAITQAVLYFRKDAALSVEDGENGGSGANGGLEQADGGVLLWKSGKLVCRSGDYGLELTGGKRDHLMALSAGVQTAGNVQAVVVNLLTPFDHTIRIRPFRVDALESGAQ